MDQHENNIGLPPVTEDSRLLEIPGLGEAASTEEVLRALEPKFLRRLGWIAVWGEPRDSVSAIKLAYALAGPQASAERQQSLMDQLRTELGEVDLEIAAVQDEDEDGRGYEDGQEDEAEG